MTTPHRRRHPVLAHLPFGLVLAVVALGLLRIILYHWREGTVLMGAALYVSFQGQDTFSTAYEALQIVTGGSDAATDLISRTNRTRPAQRDLRRAEAAASAPARAPAAAAVGTPIFTALRPVR